MKAYLEWKCEHCCCIRVFSDDFPVHNGGKCGGYLWTAQGYRAADNTLEISGVLDMAKSNWPIVFAVRDAAAAAGFLYVQWESDMGDGVLKPIRYRLRQIFSREPEAAVTDLSNLPVPAGLGAAGKEGLTAPIIQQKELTMAKGNAYFSITIETGEKDNFKTLSTHYQDGFDRQDLINVQTTLHAAISAFLADNLKLGQERAAAKAAEVTAEQAA